MRIVLLLPLLIGALALGGCSRPKPEPAAEADANTIPGRFKAPEGYEREKYLEDSYQEYIRKLPLKDEGAPVLYYNGEVKEFRDYVSVFDIPILEEDLIQCADAAIKIRAEYLYSERRYGEIEFEITNGMMVPFSRFMEGFRPEMSGNDLSWAEGYGSGAAREVFDEYLKFIYSYAGTYSLSKELRSCPNDEVEIGDMYVVGGFPGHVVIVVDVARNEETHEKAMLLAQSYMPSQDIHILTSPYDISPWYYVRDEELKTPEWEFARGCLMRFGESKG